MGEFPAPPDRPLTLRPRPAVFLVVAVALIAAAATRLIPDGWRPYNFAAIGALALYGSARIGLVPGMALALGAMAIGDAYQWLDHDRDPDYLPSPTGYACFALYAILGWALLRKSESPARIACVTVSAGTAFFLITNFVSWANQTLPYGYSLAGLFHSYVMGLPFYCGTLIGDLFFVGLSFGLHAALVRAQSPDRRSVPVIEEARA